MSASLQLSALAQDLYRMGPEIRKQLKQNLLQIGAPLLADARRRAGFSSRIPAAITVKPVASDTAGTVGLVLRVSVGEGTPHARPYEGGGNGGTFKHPLFGDREVWVTQASRPYAWPSVMAHRDDAERAAARAVEMAAVAAKFH